MEMNALADQLIPAPPFSLNLRGRLVEYTRPVVMGIVNLTADSFYGASRCAVGSQFTARIAQMLQAGADILDLGACSTRPGAAPVELRQEIELLEPAVRQAKALYPDCVVSVDTFRGEVARRAVEEWGADIINDISGGKLDPEMLTTVERLKAPYILTHMRGTPQTMSRLTDYPDGVTAGVISELSPIVGRLTQAGVADIIIDPGFGFAKTLEQNYILMRELPAIRRFFNRPVLVGISRKSMIYNLCGCTPEDALPGTTALNTFALMHGASILRVHDVAAARQTCAVVRQLYPPGCPEVPATHC